MVYFSHGSEKGAKIPMAATRQNLFLSSKMKTNPS
jgi:hypothetical protein